MSKSYAFLGDGTKDAPWYPLLPSQDQDIVESHLKDFFELMFERQEIWYKRNILKENAPWTNNEIFQKYKFTNVYRELDRGSKFLIENIIKDENNSIEDLLLKIIIYRFYNKPETFCHPKYKVELDSFEDFDYKKIHKQTCDFRLNVDNPWHTAYMMNVVFCEHPKDFVNEYGGLFKDYAYCEFVFSRLKEKVTELCLGMKNNKFDSPKSFCKSLEKLPAVSKFQSHELYIDFCYIRKYSNRHKDFFAWNENDYTSVGPGASLGIRLILPKLLANQQETGIHFLRHISKRKLENIGNFKYIKIINKKVEVVQKSELTLHQIEMWLCEYSKYWKMVLGEGKSRAKFTPKAKPTAIIE